MIELRAVRKTYGEGAAAVEALRSVDLTVESKQFVSIMGPSGSGKSTLLNLLGALDVPSSGSIRVEGQDIGRLDDDALTCFRRDRVGLVFQFFHLLPTVSVLDNVLLPITFERRPSRADRARAQSLLEQVGLGARGQHVPSQLSGGEMQRVAIARALIRRPSLLLADEPTGNLDTKTGEAILQLLREARDASGTTIIMVTHDPRAAAVGDRLLRVQDGRIVADEVPADVQDREVAQ